MRFWSDQGGLALKAEVKLAKSASTWNTRLSQIARARGEVHICTFSLPRDMTYLARIFQKRSDGISIIINSKFRDRACALKRLFPSLVVLLAPDVHAKFALLEPDTVWLSSQNLCHSGSFEQTIGIHSRDAYDFYRGELVAYLGRTSVEELEATDEPTV